MWIPFMLSLLLGRTFNNNNFKTGPDIYSAESLQSGIKKVPRYISDTKCRFIENDNEARDMLAAAGEVSVAAEGKAIGASLSISGDYLSDERDRLYTIEYMCKVSYETETHTILDDTRPFGLADYSKEDLGTHYVKSVTYGGELIASVIFKAKNKRDISRVAGKLKVGVTYEGVGVTDGRQFEIFSDEITDSIHMDIKYYSTTPINAAASNLEEMYQSLDSFKDDVAKVNGGLGSPIRVQLAPLSALDRRLDHYIPNLAITSKLEDFQLMIDDVSSAQQQLASWARSVSTLSDSLETKMGALSQSIQTMYNTLMKMSAELSYDAPNSQPLLDVMASYRAASRNLPYHYVHEVRKMKKKVEAELGHTI